MTPQQQIIADLIDQYPTHGSATIARLAYKENPEVFPSERNARWSVRRMRGAAGKERKTTADQSRFKPHGKSGMDGFAIPRGKTCFANWEPVSIEGPARALILSDIHIPYHAQEPLMAALRWGHDAKANLVLLNGDIADFFAVSSWEKDPRERDFQDELNTVKNFLATLRAGFPKARIIYKLGNHEERFERYLIVKAPELFGVADFEINRLLDFEKLGIELVRDKRPVRLGHLNVVHGHEYRFAISNPVSPARGLFLRCKAYALCGHFHQSSYYTDRTVEQSNIATWSTGCLCDLHPDYLPLNNWSHGFAFVEVEQTGKFHVQNKYVSGSKVY